MGVYKYTQSVLALSWMKLILDSNSDKLILRVPKCVSSRLCRVAEPRYQESFAMSERPVSPVSVDGLTSVLAL